MSGQQPMPPTRRRPIPGMASDPSGLGQESTLIDPQPADLSFTESRAEIAGGDGADGQDGARQGRAARRPAADYAITRLVNFRIPVDLHERFRGLIRETEIRHRRLRKPSLTELVIALLEEGPQTADEVAEMIRRKRAAEHEER
jgi:hypothetical protein